MKSQYFANMYLIKNKIREFVFEHVVHIIVTLHTASLVLSNNVLVKYKFPFPIFRILVRNHQVLLKDRFLKKILLKRAPVLKKTIG